MAAFGKRWTKQELDILSSTDDFEELAILLPNRTLGAIKSKRKELTTFSSEAWTEDEILKFPSERVVNTLILQEVAEKLPNRSKDQIWKKMKSRGYIWDKDFKAEATEENPYPDHGKKWTAEELSRFPADKNVDAEILKEVQALFPRRKPSSIWPKMKKEGYIWIPSEEIKEEEVISSLSSEEELIFSIAYELGFRKPEKGITGLQPYLQKPADRRSDIANKFDLPEDFTQGELHYAIGTRITPFPWEMEPIPEVVTAHHYRDHNSILEAAKALHSRLEAFING